MNQVAVLPRVLTVDASGLQRYAFNRRSVLFWGIVCLCLIEGTALALAFVTYFYVRPNFNVWPPSHRMPLVAGSIATVGLLATLYPMWKTGRAAKTLDLKTTRRWQLVSTVVGAIVLALRAWEIQAIPFEWTENAYASSVWFAFGLHTVDFVAEMGEMIVLTTLLFRGPLESKHFEDIEVNAIFWAFLVVAWLPFACVFYIDGAIR
jgi:cytochrome c oxidase subunit III